MLQMCRGCYKRLRKRVLLTVVRYVTQGSHRPIHFVRSYIPRSTRDRSIRHAACISTKFLMSQLRCRRCPFLLFIKICRAYSWLSYCLWSAWRCVDGCTPLPRIVHEPPLAVFLPGTLNVLYSTKSTHTCSSGIS